MPRATLGTAAIAAGLDAMETPDEAARSPGGLLPRLHEGVYAFALGPPGLALDGLDVVATMREEEGLTVVLPEDRARRAGLEVLFRAAWITLELPTALDAVGLTARFAGALAERGISCNVIAGAFHDHLFVDVERGPEARDVLAELRWDPA